MDVEEGIREGIRTQPRPAPSRSRQRDPDTSCWGCRGPNFPPRPGPWSLWCRQQPPARLLTERPSPGERWESLPEEHRLTLWGAQLWSCLPSPSPLWPWTVGRGTRRPKTKSTWSSYGGPVEISLSVCFFCFFCYLEGQEVFILVKVWGPPLACCLLCSCVKTCTTCWMDACCEFKEQNGLEQRTIQRGCETDQHQDDAAGSSIWLNPLAVEQPFTTLGQTPLWDLQKKHVCSNTVKPFSFLLHSSEQSCQCMPWFYTSLYPNELITHVCLCLIVIYCARLTGLNRLPLLLWVVLSYCQ